jgi:hypothetical protein
LRELALIQALRPTLNIAGAFAGRYPFWGLRREPDGTVLFCHTAHPDSAPGFALSGAWRSRALSEAAFAALMRLLSLLGHPETGRKARGSGRGKTPEREALAELHGRVVRFRQLPGPLIDALPAALREAADEWVVDLSLDLLERPAARRRAEAVAADLAILSAFWRDEVTPLRAACGAVGLEAWPVPQAARDPLLLEARALGVVAAPARPPRRGKRRDRAAAAPRKRFTRSRQRPRGGRGRRGPG